MNFVKKQGVGAWLSLATLVLTIVGLIIYSMALATGNGVQTANGGLLFYDPTDSEFGAMTATVATCSVFGVIFLVLALVASQFKFDGIVKTVCDVVVGAARILIPVMLMILLLNFLYGSFNGLGWTFFSNEELEINPEATKAGTQVITSLVFFVIAAVVALVASFFSIVRKEKD